MKKKIAFFLGSSVPSSTQTLFSNLTEHISDRFDIDFVGFYGQNKFGDNVNEVTYDHPSKNGLSLMYYSSKIINEYNKRYNPTLIVLPHQFSVYGLSFLLSGCLNKTIIRLNGDIFNQYKDPLYENKVNRIKDFLFINFFSKIILKKAKGIIVQTEYMYDQCVKRGLDPQKIIVLPFPIRKDVFRKVTSNRKKKIMDELGLDEDKSIALIVGSLSKIKRRYMLDELLKKGRCSDEITFVIIGETDYGKKLSEKYSNVRYEGFVKHENIHRYYQAGDLLLHFSHHEGLPTVFQEANACGMQIIAKRANYNQYMDICTFGNVEELAKMLKNHIWKKIDTYVTPGLTKREYITYFEKMIERKDK